MEHEKYINPNKLQPEELGKSLLVQKRRLIFSIDTYRECIMCSESEKEGEEGGGGTFGENRLRDKSSRKERRAGSRSA